MADEALTVRPATRNDLDLVVVLTRAARRQLARWAPVYFNPAANADMLHAAFLEFMLDSEDHVTQVMMSRDGIPVGFFAEHSLAGRPRMWIDDLCVADDQWWPLAAGAITATVTGPWVTCVSSQDRARTTALTANGLSVVSTYWARGMSGIEPARQSGPGSFDFDAGKAALHTFGAGAFRPDDPGALVVANDDGYAIGSPSVTPPIYDPGGPSTVIDQVAGPNRSDALQMAVAAAAERGDAQVIVVCGDTDSELSAIVADVGFDRVVDLIGR